LEGWPSIVGKRNDLCGRHPTSLSEVIEESEKLLSLVNGNLMSQVQGVLRLKGNCGSNCKEKYD